MLPVPLLLEDATSLPSGPPLLRPYGHCIYVFLKAGLESGLCKYLSTSCSVAALQVFKGWVRASGEQL